MGDGKLCLEKRKISINKVVVSSKEELKTAIKRKEPYIEVQGDLAKKMKWMGKLSIGKNRCNHSITNIVSSSAGRWRINC